MPAKIKRLHTPPIQTALAEPSSPQRTKKLKLLASHSLESPFPDFTRPTPAEAADVHALLARTHPDLGARRRPPLEENDAARTCGRVPNVLESLIGTILSQNTSSRNSSAAKRGLDAAFGRNDFAAIAAAPRAALVAAIRTGGLANKKAAVIQNVLREVRARHGAYSLQHLAGAAPGHAHAHTSAGADGHGGTPSDEAAMAELVSYDGVGPKTASCVLLFCLGRASFPVDTHVFRLARLLGWVPARADRVTAQAHLDLKIPAELKYGLHVLMIGHGKRCKGCKGGAGSAKIECVLKKWLREERGVKEEELEMTVAKVEEEAEIFEAGLLSAEDVPSSKVEDS